MKATIFLSLVTFTLAYSGDDMVNLINKMRARQNLPALRVSSVLTAAARGHCSDMAKSGKISYYGTDGSDNDTRCRKAGFKKYCASLLAKCRKTEQEVESLWAGSNYSGTLYGKGFREVGCDVETSNVPYVTCVFGKDDYFPNYDDHPEYKDKSPWDNK